MFRAGSVTLARAQLARLAAADVCRRSGHATAEAAARETTQLRHFQHHRRVGPAAAGMGTGPVPRGTDLRFEGSAPFLLFLSPPPPRTPSRNRRHHTPTPLPLSGSPIARCRRFPFGRPDRARPRIKRFPAAETRLFWRPRCPDARRRRSIFKRARQTIASSRDPRPNPFLLRVNIAYDILCVCVCVWLFI